MTELSLRLLFLLGIAVVIALVAWVGSRRDLARPEKAVRPDLAPGVHFFSADTCLSCVKARRVLDGLVPGYSEIRFEDDPPGFGRFAIANVPTVIVVGEKGEATLFEGVPRRRDLKNVMRGT